MRSNIFKSLARGLITAFSHMAMTHAGVGVHLYDLPRRIAIVNDGCGYSLQSRPSTQTSGAGNPGTTHSDSGRFFKRARDTS
jgi:hypothetical protein